MLDRFAVRLFLAYARFFRLFFLAIARKSLVAFIEAKSFFACFRHAELDSASHPKEIRNYYL